MAQVTSKKLQVFVSSTYEDLKEERQAAVRAILDAGHIPAGMELFAAGDEEQMKVIRQWIDESDVFMLIVGGRYGSIEEGSQKSYTHLEWDYAIAQRKRHFACVMKDDALQRKALDKKLLKVLETDNPEKFKTFRAHVAEARIVAYWSNDTEIQLAVFKSLGNYAKDESLAGWIRGDQAVTAEVANQIARLTGENQSLRTTVTSLSEQVKAIEAPKKSEAEEGPNIPSADAIELLLSADESDGNIELFKIHGDYVIRTKAKTFNNIGPNGLDPRETARWKAAIAELKGEHIIEQTNSGGTILNFKITNYGYKLADYLRQYHSNSKAR